MADAWRGARFVRIGCAARLERKNPQIVLPLLGFLWGRPCLALAGWGHRFAVIAEVV